MSAPGKGEPTYYTSLYRHGVDQKRRVQIPSKWRASDPADILTVILWLQHSAGPCLRVLPPSEMSKLMSDIAAMPSSDPSKTVLKRFIGSQSVEAILDKAGRLCIPEAMARTAGIEDEAVLVGLLDRFEIWSPARYEIVEHFDGVLASEALKLIC